MNNSIKDQSYGYPVDMIPHDSLITCVSMNCFSKLIQYTDIINKLQENVSNDKQVHSLNSPKWFPRYGPANNCYNIKKVNRSSDKATVT